MIRRPPRSTLFPYTRSSDLGERSRAATAATAVPPPAFAPNAFIRIGTDGRITLIMNQVEMGQGMYTSMPMLLADRKSTRLNSSHSQISYAVFCLKKKKKKIY